MPEVQFYKRYLMSARDDGYVLSRIEERQKNIEYRQLMKS